MFEWINSLNALNFSDKLLPFHLIAITFRLLSETTNVEVKFPCARSMKLNGNYGKLLQPLTKIDFVREVQNYDPSNFVHPK